MPELAEARGVQNATAESCIGGQIASLLTTIPALGRYFDRGFVAYTEDATMDGLRIPAMAIARHGAVSLKMLQQVLVEGLGGIS